MNRAHELFPPPVLDVDFGDGPNGTTPAPKPPAIPARSITDFKLPASGDPSILLGDRYLSRGDIAILSSTSSMGKSSATIQMAYSWALGRDFLGGMKPARPLSILIFQSEDGDGDVAEVALSMAKAMKLTPDELAQVGSRVKVVTDREHCGPFFLAQMKLHIDLHRPDIVFINPLLAFIGGDVNDAEAVGAFIRSGLNSRNSPPTHAYVIVHHTAKPPKEKTERKWNEVMYEMAGSADLTNAARAVICLQAREEEGEFNMVLAKRGRRAGFSKKVKGRINPGMEFDELVTTVHVRWSRETFSHEGQSMRLIHWERFEPATAAHDDTPKGRPSKYAFAEFAAYFPKFDQPPKTAAQIHRIISPISGIPISSFKDLVSRAHKDGLVERLETSSGFAFRLAP